MNEKAIRFALENGTKLPIYKKIKSFIEEDLKEIYTSRITEIDLWITNLKMFNEYDLQIARYYVQYISALDDPSNSDEEIWESIKDQILLDLSSNKKE